MIIFAHILYLRCVSKGFLIPADVIECTTEHFVNTLSIDATISEETDKRYSISY